MLQLHDLQGDIVGTVGLAESETKLFSTYNSTEFGVPTTSSPPKYSWLGAIGITDALPSGVANQGGASYVPLIARTLQTAGITIPAAEITEVTYVNLNSSWIYENAAGASERQIAAANAARQALEGGGSALFGGGEEEGGGGGGGCSGMNACAASVHRSQKCQLEVMVGEEHGEVWSRAWAGCGGMRLPGLAWLYSCLAEESSEGAAPVGGQLVGCSPAVFGSQDPYRLYSSYEYKCLSGVIFYGLAGVWIPGAKQVEYKETKRGWQCGESRTEATLNFVWLLVELGSDRTG
jgi:hypothetical protein